METKQICVKGVENASAGGGGSVETISASKVTYGETNVANELDELSQDTTENEQIVSYALNNLNTQKVTALQMNNALAESEAIISYAFNDIDNGKLPLKAVTELYSTVNDYAEGDYCVHDGLFYRCTTAVSKGKPFTPSAWEQTTVMAEIKRLINN